MIKIEDLYVIEIKINNRPHAEVTANTLDFHLYDEKVFYKDEAESIVNANSFYEMTNLKEHHRDLVMSYY